MQFKVGHPDYPQYDFYTLAVLPELERLINKWGPLKFLTGSYDWPRWFAGFRGWTDSVNSLWWPAGADNFATLVLVIDDTREQAVSLCVQQQRAAAESPQRVPWPHLIVTAQLGIGETFPQIGIVEPVSETVAVIEWKLYPLAPVPLTQAGSVFKGLWLLPLVDERYFRRNIALNGNSGSSGSGPDTLSPYPIVWVDPTDTAPSWMPPLRAYPDDTTLPANYIPIENNQLHPNIDGSMRWGEAVELQANLQNWRTVCRDVRSNYSNPSVLFSHVDFTGVVSDYPEPTTPSQYGYHTDAMTLHAVARANYVGDECDLTCLGTLTARKLQIQFRARGDDAFYAVATSPAPPNDFPTTTSQVSVVVAEPSDVDRAYVPVVTLGVPVSSRYPSVLEEVSLEAAAKQWTLLYYRWRASQAYFKYPGIYPVIPNGYAHAIRWDFSAGNYLTTYVAIEGVQGTAGPMQVSPEPFYARIDGEGSVDDDLQGYYAWTELADVDGELTPVDPYPRQGFVAGVDDAFVTVDAARDEAGKVAVPVGLVVLMVPGVPYLDIALNRVTVPYRFTTTDLVQIVTIKQPEEVNEFGHYAGYVQRWDNELKRFVQSEEIWLVVLEGA